MTRGQSTQSPKQVQDRSLTQTQSGKKAAATLMLCLLALCMCVIMAAGCGSDSGSNGSGAGQDASGANSETSGNSEADGSSTGTGGNGSADITYEEYSCLGLTFRLPEGTTEEEEKEGKTYNYYNGDLYVMMFYLEDLKLTDENVREYATAVTEDVEDAQVGDITKREVGGQPGYQFDVTGTYGETRMILTYTTFQVPTGSVAVGATMKSTQKDDYSAINETMLDSIEIDDDYYAKLAQPDYYVKKRTAVTEDCTIKITGYKVLRPGEGANSYGSDPVIVFEYDMTNTSGGRMTPAVEWPIIVDVVQDNDPDSVNRLTPAVILDGSATDSMKEIKAGGTVHCSNAYTLTDLKTPVTLTIRNGVVGETLGTMKFRIR